MASNTTTTIGSTTSAGTTLATLVQSSGPGLTPEFVVEIIAQVCRSVQAVHDKGTLHGALTPHNIRILEDGHTAKILDFGLAQSAASQLSSGWKAAHNYLAPEQLGRAHLNRSSDIFSLGVIAYEALTLHQPFTRPTTKETTEAIRHFVPPPLAQKNPQVPPLLGHAVEIALAKRPDQRYTSAGAFADALEKAIADHPIEQPLPADPLQPETAESARAEKEKLFTIAQRHHRNGELASALAALEKGIALFCHVPELEKAFHALYAEVKSECDRIDQSCAEAAQANAQNNFAAEFAIYENLWARYPNNQQFQAMRLRAQQAQRQQLLAYIAEVASSVEAQPNLDGRVYLLTEAVKRYPNEDLFARQLSLACEQRDLAASIVAKARAYQAQGQFGDATEQWKALATICPLYPNLAAEREQLEQGRLQQAEEEKRSVLLAKIERTLATGDHTAAERFTHDALREFPDHPQLLALLTKSQQSFEDCGKADHLLSEARAARASNDPDRALTLLRQALELDPRHVVARNTLLNLLLDRARALLNTDPSAAELIASEAVQLEPHHSSVQKLLKLVAKSKPKKHKQPALLEAPPKLEPAKLFLDDDDFRDSSAASHRAPSSQFPSRSRESAVLRQFREIGSVLVYNIKTRLLDSSLAPLLPSLTSESTSQAPVVPARPVRGWMIALFGALLPLLLFSFTHKHVSQPPVLSPVVASAAAATPEPKISAPEAAAPVAAPEPSYATLSPDENPAATNTTPPPPEPASPQRVSPSTPLHSERAPRHLDISAKSSLPPRFTIFGGTPGATVAVDDIGIGELDAHGNFSYPGMTAGTHKIQLSKPGYGARTFYGQKALPGKSFDLPGDKTLIPSQADQTVTLSLPPK